jgi:EmrB/QacA subfamily drug resistance transporter
MIAPEVLGGPTRRQRLGILAICCMSLLIVGLDTTIVNVALPSISHDFHTSVSGLQWTIDAYIIVLGSLLMLGGSTADRVGRKRTFQVGLIIFGGGSLLCSLAPNLDFLIAFRALQAVGGSMLNPVAMSIITNTFTDRKERAQAIGVWGGVVGVSMGLGPVVGGLLVSTIGWQSIFWINVPITIAACLLTARYVPESQADRPRRPDPLAQVLLIAILATATFAIIEGPDYGWASPAIVVCFAFAVLALTALIRYESRREQPLIDPRFFRSVPFSCATVIAVAAFAGLGGFLFLNTLYLQESRGLSALDAGLDTLPMALMVMILSPLSGWLVGKAGARLPLTVAGAFITISAVALTRLTGHTSFTWLFAAYLAFGIGFGVVNAPITNAAVSGMPLAQAGVAAAVASTSRQIGQALGVAVLGAIVSGATHAEFPTATHLAFWIMAGSGVTIAVLGLVSTTGRARESAEAAAALF